MDILFVATNEDIYDPKHDYRHYPLDWYGEELPGLVKFYSTFAISRPWRPTKQKSQAKRPVRKPNRGQVNNLGLSYDAKKQGSSGKINARRMYKAMKAIPLDGRPLPVLSSNFAHHFSWALSRLAFEKHGRDGVPKVVVNFDLHTDYGGTFAGREKTRLTLNDDIVCGNWGQFHLRCEWSPGSPAPAYYVVLGGYSPAIYFLDDVHAVKPQKLQALGGKGTTNADLLSKLRKRLGSKECDLYLTLDRDVLADGRTHYEQGKQTSKKLAELFLGVRNSLGKGKINLVGADVCGLPPKRGYKGGKIEESDARRAVRDIKDFHKYVSNKPFGRYSAARQKPPVPKTRTWKTKKKS